MERCSNCGAATRPGAKFCTSCGTRLNLDQDSTGPVDSSWNSTSSMQESPVATPAVEDGDITTMREAVTPPPHWEETVQDPRPEHEDEEPAAAWSSGSPWTSGETEPAVEAEAQGVRVSEESDWSSKWHSDERVDDAADAGSSPDSTPSEDNRWAWNTTNDEAPAAVEESVTFTASATERDTIRASGGGDTETGWTPSLVDVEMDEVAQESETIVPAPDAIGLSEAGESGITGDERVSAADWDSAIAVDPSAPDSGEEQDPRERATTLLDELRALVWKIGEEEPAGDNDIITIANNLRSVRGETADFSDLREVIGAVRENPRDIDALRDLGLQADRLQALLDSHASLTSALDEAIRTLQQS
jgi:hypothetical protein